MAEFIVGQHATRDAIGGADTTRLIPMPILPLSAVFLTIEANLIAANTADIWTQLLDQLKSIQFRYRGTQIWAVRGTDLYRTARALGIWGCRPEHQTQGAAARRILTLCIPFGRRLFDPDEAFPAVAKGETELFIDITAASASYNTLKFTVESLQLPGATPKNFLRCTTISDTPTATGDKDYDLPRAAPILAVGFVQTNSEPTAASPDIERVKILLNNQDYDYSLISSMLMRNLGALKKQHGVDLWAHTHVENTAGAYAQNATSLTDNTSTSTEREFLWLEFDPLGDGQYALPGPIAQDLKARVNFNTAAAIRILPVELWQPSIIFRK